MQPRGPQDRRLHPNVPVKTDHSWREHGRYERIAAAGSELLKARSEDGKQYPLSPSVLAQNRRPPPIHDAATRLDLHAACLLRREEQPRLGKHEPAASDGFVPVPYHGVESAPVILVTLHATGEVFGPPPALIEHDTIPKPVDRLALLLGVSHQDALRRRHLNQP